MDFRILFYGLVALALQDPGVRLLGSSQDLPITHCATIALGKIEMVPVSNILRDSSNKEVIGDQMRYK